MKSVLEVKNLSASFGPHPQAASHPVLKGISLSVTAEQITAIIGPSGCGKSTFLRCINRMHEVVHGATVDGDVLLNGKSVYGKGVDPVLIRRRVGMVFQKPTPFPTMSIYHNVAVGLRLNGLKKKAVLDEQVEVSLRKVVLWDEVKDRLSQPGTSLSGGQQQRLCVARALAVNPEVLLLDEPTSALDPMSSGKIEELLRELKKSYTIVIVTHNMQQAARLSDMTGFFLMGELIEFDATSKIFTTPTDARTEDYITGRFG
ncbi:MAG: phosphate ABC transporter ATP-binding protein [Nitrospirae bacterium]|nr:phosphate ABC transporter ATP-binding protein [Candidatus Troglogloeales bacterium]MBI3598346.1 phosphate ABC transporter ATP-binding protein [Candidatus Troglogloeales bacterium]